MTRIKIKFRSIDGVMVKQLPSLFSRTYGHGFRIYIYIFTFISALCDIVIFMKMGQKENFRSAKSYVEP